MSPSDALAYLRAQAGEAQKQAGELKLVRLDAAPWAALKVMAEALWEEAAEGRCTVEDCAMHAKASRALVSAAEALKGGERG